MHRRQSIMRPKVVISSRRPECSAEYWIIGAWYANASGSATLCGPKKFLGVMEDLAGRFLSDGARRVSSDEQRARVVVEDVLRAEWDLWIVELRRTCRVRFVRRMGRLCG